MTDLDRKLAKAARECSADAVRRTFAAGRPITILVSNRDVGLSFNGKTRQFKGGVAEAVKFTKERKHK